MGCWVVEAASGQWHDRLRKSVMLWEEFPVAVKAFETGSPATGENLRDDHRPEVIRRNLMGQSLLSLPLLSQGRAFGVLVLVMERAIPPSAWNLRLAEGFAEQAAVAVANARLYEAAKEKGKGLELRLKHLEHLAETLAHDMKGPGERMDGLARLTLTKFGHTLEPEAARLLALIQENGQILSEHIETILEVSRVGVGPDTVEAVDPSSVISEVLKEKASELEERQVRVSVDPDFPLVACHRAYLRQVFDNLISNAVKYMGDQPHPTVRIESVRGGDRAQFRVSDNGVGIPPNYRKRVFDPFFRLAAEAKGSGIGLTIVKRIVELYGGEIWIDSTTEQGGCAVAFTLPVLGDLTADSPREGVRW
jgi:signal transduction histidine kinase